VKYFNIIAFHLRDREKCWTVNKETAKF